MTTEDASVLFRNAVLSGYVLPGLLVALCVFGGVVVALGLRRNRDTTMILGAFFVVSGLYLGERYTVIPVLVFGLTVLGGLFGSLCSGLFTRAKRAPAQTRRTPQRQLE